MKFKFLFLLFSLFSTSHLWNSMIKKLIFFAFLLSMNQSTECEKKKRTPTPYSIYEESKGINSYRDFLNKEMEKRTAQKKNTNTKIESKTTKMEGICFGKKRKEKGYGLSKSL